MLKKPSFTKPVWILYPQALKRVKQGRCSRCNRKIKEKDFRDELSKKEYSISGMCQECQDITFGKTKKGG